MRIERYLIIVLIILIGISILSIFTPLTFTNVWLRNVWYLLTVLLSVVAGFRTKKGWLKYILIFLPAIFLLGLFLLNFGSLADRITDKWRTAWISHRKGSKYIGGQTLDIGARGYARRTVVVYPLTPLFEWTTAIDTATLDSTWIRTDEYLNPYNLK